MSDVIDGIVKDINRARDLGLIPDGNGAVSKRGQFQIHPSNIEELENRKMRNYRYKPFPKAVHRWGVDPVHPGQPPCQLDMDVKDAKELQAALEAGWSEDPVLEAPADFAEPVAVEVSIAPPKRGRRKAVA